MTNKAPGLPDAVLSGLAAMVGAGLLVGIAPAAGAAGVWLLAGLMLAALIAIGLGLSTAEHSTFLLLLGQSAGMAAIAGAFGRYLVPGAPKVAAVVLIVIATVLTIAGFTPPKLLNMAGVVVVLIVLAIVVVACLAIEPPRNVPGSDNPGGLPLATVFLIFAFLGTERTIGTRRHRLIAIGAALLLYLAVAGAALRQLGSARLALSPVPLRDALAAADASGLDRILTVGAALATVLALLSVLSSIKSDNSPPVTAAAGGAAALGALLLTVPTLMIVAVALVAAHQLLVIRRRGPARTPRRSARS